MLVERGMLAFDRPIATWWPAFGANGKEAITLRDALSHRAGLAALDADLSKADVIAWTPVIEAIEAQRPRHQPAAGHLYHAMTYGWIVGEVIRRVTGRTPAGSSRTRSSVRWASGHGSACPSTPDRRWPGWSRHSRTKTARWRGRPRSLADASVEVERSVTMSGAFAFPAHDGWVTFNDPELQAAEIPAANGIATARSLARLYAGCVSKIDGQPLVRRDVLADAIAVRSAGPQLSGMPDDGARWGTGFQLASPPSQPMLGPASFGHAGAGGQLAFGDLEHEVGFAYLGNQMGGFGDARARELTAALGRVLRV